MANLSNINNKFLVTTGGNVLIGQTAAVGTSIFQVSGEALFGNGTDGLLLSYSNGNSSGIIDTGHSSTALEFRVGNTQELLINGSSATFAGTVIGTTARFDTLNNNANSKNIIYRNNSSTNTVVGGGSSPDKIYIQDNGNVGIGTSLPGTKLEVKMNDTASNRLGFTGDGSTTGSAMWTNWQTGNSYLDFRLGGTTDTYTKMRITSDGNVGIGTTSPPSDHRLQIHNAGAAYSRFALTNSSTGVASGDGLIFQMETLNSIIKNQENGTLGFGTNGRETDILIKTSGNVGIGETSPDARLHISALASNGISNVKLESPGASKWAFGIPASQTYFALDDVNDNLTTPRLVVLKTSGNVGIGTDSPDSKLDVKGASATPADGNQILSITNTTGGTQLNLGTAENSYGWIEAREGATLRNLLLNPNGGNVGIGTTSPFTNLEVAGSGADSIIRLYAAGGTANIRTWEMRAVGVAGEGLLFRQVNDANNSYTNRMIIDTDGNVGIGTISPDSNLEVVGTTVISTVTDGVNAVLIGLAGSNRTTIQFDTADTTHTNRQWGLTNIAGDFYIGRHGLNVMKMNNNGDVGIGTTSPIAPLHVVTPAVGGIDLTNISRTANNLVRFTNPEYSTSATMGLLLRVFPDSDARQGAGLLMTGGSDNAASNLSLFVSKDDGTSSNISKSYSALHIAGNTGNVGIGTTSPIQKLDTPNIVIGGSTIAGTYRANALFMDNNGGNSRFYSSGPNGTTQGSYEFNIMASDANPLQTVLVINNSGNVGIGTTSPSAKLQVSNTDLNRKTMIQGNGTNQGFSHKATLVNHYPVVSAGTQLIIPFTSQGNLNSTTIIKIWGHSARFNSSDPRGFEATIQLGHLSSLYNVSAISGSGNISGVSASGMNLIISFITAYTNASLSDGLFATIEYMTNNLSYSLQPTNIVMN